MPPMCAPTDPAELPATDITGRIPRLRASLAAAGCDALVVTKLVNIRYLIGFSGSAATVLLTDTEALAVTDGRYRDQMS